MDKINATLMSLRFDSGDGFIIGNFVTDGNPMNSNIVAKGNVINPHIGLDYILSGSWVDDPKWGRQFNIKAAERKIPKTIPGIRNYLVKMAPGVGPKMADSIVRIFGTDALDVLKGDPEEVSSKISGLTHDKAKAVKEVLLANDNNEAVMMKLIDMFNGIKGIFKDLPKQCISLWSHDAADKIELNPYILTGIRRVGFPMADSVAIKLNYPLDGIFRKKAAVVHAIKTLMKDGHIWLNKMRINMELQKIIEYPCDEAFTEMINQGELVSIHTTESNFTTQTYFALRGPFKSEELNARSMMDFVFSRNNPFLVPTTDLMEESQDGFRLDDTQVEAVQMALSNNILIIYGYAGTGKTTVLKEILRQMECHGVGVAIACPTGKAAKRASESTGTDAKTIHRLLECIPTPDGGFTFNYNEDNPIPVGCLILDEVSMVDNELMGNVMRAVDPSRTRLILVGDPGQLPSVGPGQVFKDLIDSGRIPMKKLDTGHRSSGLIVQNANKVRQGLFYTPNLAFDPYGDGSRNMFHIETSSTEDTLDTITDMYCGYFPTHFKDIDNPLVCCDPVKDVQILSPFKDKTMVGCEHINNVIQMKINKYYKPQPPAKPGQEIQRFFESDKVLNSKNGEVDGFYIVNGDTGTVHEVGANYIVVHFEDYGDNGINLKFVGKQRKQLQLSYAMTIHKSQGSEYRFVIIPCDNAFTYFADRRLLYTALTRGKHGVVTVGDSGALMKIIKNENKIIRETRLIEKLGEFDL